MQADDEALQAINDVGPVAAGNVIEFFANAGNREVIQAMLDAGVHFPEKAAAPAVAENDSLAGNTYVLTGTLEAMTRDEAKRLLQSLGPVYWPC